MTKWNKKKNHFIKEINKYTAVFDYVDQNLLVLSAKGGVVSITSLVIAVGVPVGIARAIIV